MKKRLSEQQQLETVSSEVDEFKARQIREILDNEVFRDLIIDFKTELLMQSMHIDDGDSLKELHLRIRTTDEVLAFIQAALDKYEY